MNNLKPSARIYVLISKESKQAIIIRTGPSARNLTMGWDLINDQFTKGQWLKGKIYIHKCDISPDGKHWVYFAYKAHAYTVIAKTPYLKALHYFENDTTYGGGGYFHNDKDLILSVPPDAFNKVKNTSFSIQKDSKDCDVLRTISIFQAYMRKNDWHCIEQKAWDEGSRFQKRINQEWRLSVISQGIGYTRSDGGQKEFLYALQHIKSGTTIETSDWDWADYEFYNNRMIWAKFGKIMTGKLDDSTASLINVKCLLDMNDMQFEEIIAPYSTIKEKNMFSKS